MATGRLRGEARAAARVVGDVLLVAVFRMAVIGAFTLRLGRATMPEGPSVVVVFFNDQEADLTTADSRGSWQADVRVDARLPITHDHGLRGRAERLERVGASGLGMGVVHRDAADRLTPGTHVTQADVVAAGSTTVATATPWLARYSRELHDGFVERHDVVTVVATPLAVDRPWLDALGSSCRRRRAPSTALGPLGCDEPWGCGSDRPPASGGL